MATAEEVKEQLQRVTDAVGSVFFGKEEEIREILLGLVANGHVLLEDLPGTGKTTLAVAFSKVLSLDYRRVQFTPDLLPSDLTGFSVYDPERKEFVYREGAVFTNLLLADEINRTSPKTQAALLEVMEERQVTVEGTTRPLSAPFLVIGTQNPAGAVGTELLPEAEIDRFMISMSIGIICGPNSALICFTCPVMKPFMFLSKVPFSLMLPPSSFFRRISTSKLFWSPASFIETSSGSNGQNSPTLVLMVAL